MITQERYAELAGGAEMTRAEGQYLSDAANPHKMSAASDEFGRSGLGVAEWQRLVEAARDMCGIIAPPSAEDELEARRWELSKRHYYKEMAEHTSRMAGGR